MGLQRHILVLGNWNPVQFFNKWDILNPKDFSTHIISGIGGGGGFGGAEKPQFFGQNFLKNAWRLTRFVFEKLRAAQKI